MEVTRMQKKRKRNPEQTNLPSTREMEEVIASSLFNRGKIPLLKTPMGIQVID